jgi:glycosyltransferase involved in cell wall biosynthesis
VDESRADQRPARLHLASGGDPLSRILWCSNAPWAPSGYGGQTGLFLPRLAELGHDVAAVANFGVNGEIVGWHGILVYPSDNAWGNESLDTFRQHHKADVVIALCDAHVLRPDEWPDELNVAVWAPVDHYPVPPPVLAVLSHERITPIAMSRFGEGQMRACELDPVYVPHGVDTTLFRPQPERRAEARAALEIPDDAFLVGMVGANSDKIARKSFPQAFIAFARFANAHPDAYLYCHTRARHAMGQNLDQLATICGVPERRLKFPPEEAWHLGISAELLAVFYQAFDVLLMPSMGEGFGIPLIEAQACGVPVITTDHSAMTELGQAGWLVACEPWWDEFAKAFFGLPLIESILAGLEASYLARDNEELRAAAVKFAAQYDADRVAVDYWRPALERLLPRPESRQVRRARERREAKAGRRAEAAA